MMSRRTLTAWLSSHMARRTSAKLVAILLALLAIAIVATLFAPLREDLRVLLALFGGLGLFALAGLYFAYRTLRFARSMAAENAAMKTSLAQTIEGLARAERQRSNDHSHMTNDLGLMTRSIERKVNANLEALERGLAQVGDLRKEFFQLQSALGAAQGLSTRTAVRNEALDLKLSAVMTSIDGLQASRMADADIRQKDTAAVIERQSRNDTALQALARDGAKALEAVEDLRRRNVEAEKRTAAVIDRQARDADALQGAVKDAAKAFEAIEDLRRHSLEAEKRVDSLTMLLDTAVGNASKSAEKLSELNQAHGRIADLEQKVSTDRVTDSLVVAQLQREVVLLAEVHASANERTRLLGERAAEAVLALHDLNGRQGQFARDLSAVTTDATTALQRVEVLDQKVRDSQAAADAEGRTRYAQIAVDLQQLKVASQQAEKAAAVLSTLGQRQEAFDNKLVETKAEITRSVAGVDKLREGLESIGFEASRIASVTTELDARQGRLVEVVEGTREELAKVASATEDTATRLAASNQATEAIASSLKDLSDATAAKFTRFDSNLATHIAASSKQAEEVASNLKNLTDATGARFTQFDASLATRFAASSKQAEEVASNLKNLTDATGARFLQIDASLAARFAASSKQAEEAVSSLKNLTDATGARFTQIDSTLDARFAASSKQVEEAAASIKNLTNATTARFAQVDSNIQNVVTNTEASVAASEQAQLSIDAAALQIAKLHDDVSMASEARVHLEERMKLLTELGDDTATAAADTAAKQEAMAFELSAANEKLVAMSGRADELDGAISTLGRSMAELRETHIGSASALTSRLDAVATDFAGARTALEQRTSGILAHLAALDIKIEKNPDADRIASIESDIGQIVRLVDDAEIAFADEISRMGALASKLSEDFALISKHVSDAPATIQANLDASQKALSDLIKRDIEGRLILVERDVARVSRLVDESEVATVAELTHLSSAVLQLSDDMQSAGERHEIAPNVVGSIIDPLRLRLAKAADELEEAVRDTERTLGNLGRETDHSAVQVRVTKAKASGKGLKTKTPARSSRLVATKPQAGKTRKRR